MKLGVAQLLALATTTTGIWLSFSCRCGRGSARATNRKIYPHGASDDDPPARDRALPQDASPVPALQDNVLMIARQAAR
jgi:hypothetical protein